MEYKQGDRKAVWFESLNGVVGWLCDDHPNDENKVWSFNGSSSRCPIHSTEEIDLDYIYVEDMDTDVPEPNSLAVMEYMYLNHGGGRRHRDTNIRLHLWRRVKEENHDQQHK